VDEGDGGTSPPVSDGVPETHVPLVSVVPSGFDGISRGIVPWPEPISEEGFFGIAGEFVRLVAPHTEADPNALLVNFLVRAGHVIGSKFYIAVGADVHRGNLYGGLVGPTQRGRKGRPTLLLRRSSKRGIWPRGWAGLSTASLRARA
jgi:hypothetical protein